MQEFSSASIVPKEVLQLQNSLKRSCYLMRERQTSSTDGTISVHTARNPLLNQKPYWMCMNNLRPEMAVYLQGVRPITFENWHQRPLYITGIENTNLIT